MEVIRVKNVSFSTNNVKICKNMDLSIEKGTFYGIIGPNGSGKSTLLKQICRILAPTEGMICLNGMDVRTMSFKETAKQMGVLLQENGSEFEYTVREIIMMGRAPHHVGMQGDTKEDSDIACECLKKVGMLNEIDRVFNTLSGGEKQRVLLARALAQQADILLLDEPTNNLDIGYQYQMFELLKELPFTIFMIVHDLNLASLFCDKIAVIQAGRIIQNGTPQEVITEELLRNVFSVEAKVEASDGQRPYIRYLHSAALRI